jgi:radical SAM superfamily enzyme YgiQ (UPF0313 family)
MHDAAAVMRVVIIQAGAVDESLAVCDLAGELGARGHTVGLLLEAQERDFEGALAAFSPDVALVQAAFMGERWLKRILPKVPDGVPTVLVGTAATFDRDLVVRVGAWGALQGELDDSGPALVDALAAGRDPLAAGVPGLVRPTEGGTAANPWGSPPGDLDDRPLPDRALYFDRYPFLARFPWKRFATGRGCVHSCGFCYLPGLREGYSSAKANVRRKSVSRVIDEVRAVRSKWPLTHIHFADDLFAPDRPWLEELAERFPREVNVPFSCNTSPETITERNAVLLGIAGARVVGIGVETGSERNRNELLGRPTKDAAIRRAASRLKAQGIRLLTFNMIANPGETVEDAIATVRINQELGTDFPRINLAYPAPGSHLETLMAARGIPPIAPDAHERSDWRAWCAEGDPVPYEVLARLFRFAVRHRVPEPVLRRLMTAIPDSKWLLPMVLYDASVEMRWSGVSLIEALRYGWKVGPPNRRVTYHESLP